jgi:putative oxidoreductase
MLKRALSPFQEATYAALRIVVGFMFAFHGIQKLFGEFTRNPVAELGTQAWFGGVIELACGVLIMLGLLHRWAAFLASGTMAVAYIQFHWKWEMGEAFLPIVNRGELAVAYCFLFLYMAAKGPGRFSVDAMRGDR